MNQTYKVLPHQDVARVLLTTVQQKWLIKVSFSRSKRQLSLNSEALINVSLFKKDHSILQAHKEGIIAGRIFPNSTKSTYKLETNSNCPVILLAV